MPFSYFPPSYFPGDSTPLPDGDPTVSPGLYWGARYFGSQQSGAYWGRPSVAITPTPPYPTHFRASAGSSRVRVDPGFTTTKDK